MCAGGTSSISISQFPWGELGQVSEVLRTSKDRNSDGEGGAFHPGTPGLGCSFKSFCKELNMGRGHLITQQILPFENLYQMNEGTSLSSLHNFNRCLRLS